MRQLLYAHLIILSGLSLSGCLHHQFASISSTSPRNAGGSFERVRDSVYVGYNFDSESGRIRLRVKNQSIRPVYIDWSRSVVVHNGKVLTFPQSQSEMRGSYIGSSVDLTRDIALSSGSVSGSMVTTTGAAFMPGGSFIESEGVVIQHGYMPLRKIRGSQIAHLPSGGTGRRVSFTPEASPVRVKVHLTLSYGPSLADAFVVSDDFWVDEIMDLGVDPGPRVARNDGFYHQKATGVASVVALAGVTGVLVLAAQGDNE